MATLIPWGASDFLVNTTVKSHQYNQQLVALKNGTFLAVWQDTSADTGDVRAQIFHADGTMNGPEILVGQSMIGGVLSSAFSQQKPRIAVLNDGRFTVVWEESNGTVDGEANDTPLGLRARIFNADGTPDLNSQGGLSFRVNTTLERSQSEPFISATANGGFVVSFRGDVTVGSAFDVNVFAQAFDANGNKIGGEIAVNTTKTANPQWEPSVVGLSDGRYVVFYTDLSMSADDPASTVRGRIFAANGTAMTDEFLVSSSFGAKSAPIVTLLSDGRYVVAYQHTSGMADTGDGSGNSLKAQIYNANGTKFRGEFLVNSQTSGSQQSPSMTALAGGGFAIAYLNNGSNIAVAIFDSNGTRVGEDHVFNLPGGGTPNGRPALTALVDGRLVLSWAEIGMRYGEGTSMTGPSSGVFAQILDPRTAAVTIVGQATNDEFIGTGFNDSLSGKSGSDLLVGDGGNDTLMGGAGADTLDGGSGSDTASYADAVAAGAGMGVIASLATPGTNTGNAEGDSYDSIENLIGSNFRDELTGNGDGNTLNGGAGNDTLKGGDGADELLGGADDDTLDGGIGADTLDGGTGSDTYFVDDAGDKIKEAVGGGNDVVTASASYALDENQEIETLKATAGTLVINLKGNNFANKLEGNDASNLLDGGAGTDQLIGGLGDDAYVVDRADDAVTEVAGEENGFDTVMIASNFAVDGRYDLAAYANIEALQALNGAGGVTLIGNSGANALTGNDSANTLDGGIDTLIDTLQGGKGNDTYIIRDENDLIVEAEGEGIDTASVTFANYELAPDMSLEILKADKSAGATAFTLTGNNRANTIIGADGADVLDGGGSADDEADRLEGGAGNDIYHVRHKNDAVVEAAAGGNNDKVVAHTSYTLDNLFVEILEAAAGTESIALTGNSAGNTLVGNAGTNVLEGRGGDDTLEGGGGLDTAVFTGAKADYIITKLADGSFNIADKQVGRDGSDLLKNIRYARFSDEIVDLMAQPTLSIAATDGVKSEGSGEGWTAFTFTVTRSDTAGSPTASWSIALSGDLTVDDFQATSGSVAFEPNAATALITVFVRADKAVEANESFTVALSGATGATVSSSAGSAMGVILNDDVITTLSITGKDAIQSEGSSEGWTDFTFTVTRSDIAGSPTVNWSIPLGGDLTADDFQATSGLVTFESNTATALITVRVKADKLVEANESFTVALSGATGAAISSSAGSATGVILTDDNTFGERATDITFSDVNALKVGVSGTGASVALATAIDPDTPDGSPTNLYRFDNGESTTPDGLFVINANTGQITLNRAVTAADVGTKVINVVTYDAANHSLYYVKSHTVSILAADNDNPMDILLSRASIGEDADVGAVVALLNGVDAQGASDIVGYSLLEDADGKFEIVGNELRLLENVDREAKASHTVTIRVTDKSGGTYDKTVTIVVKDVNERPTDIVFNGVRPLKVGTSGTGFIVAQAAAVDPDVLNGVTSANLYRFDNGQTMSADGLFVINANTGHISTTRAVTAADVGTKLLNVVTYDAANPALFHVKGHTVTVVDAVPVVRFSDTAADITLDEGQGDGWTEFSYTVVRDTTVGASVVAWSIGGTAVDASDFQAMSGTVAFANGSDTATIIVRVRADAIHEDDEAFTVTLGTASGGNATIGANGTVTSTILNDDIVLPGMPIVMIDPALAKMATFDISGYVNPFRGVTFTDAENDLLTVKISFDKNKGSLGVPAGLEAYFSQDDVQIENGRSVYTFTGFAEELRVIMDALRFDAYPVPGSLPESVQTTTFFIEVNDEAHADRPGMVKTVEVESITAKVALSGGVAHEAAINYDAVPNTGTVVGTLTPGTFGHAFTYELLNDAGGRFALAADGKTLVVKNGLLLDYEQAQAHTIRVKVTAAGETFEQNLTIGVADVAAENVLGSEASERFVGGAGRDVLSGGGGHDGLVGGYGNDYLVGGLGSDSFVFNARLGSATSDRTVNFDRIADFNVAADTIQLENVIFKSLKTTRTLSSKCFVSGAKAKDKNDYIGYDKKTGRVWYDADGSGSKAAVEFAQLAKSLKLTAKDFYVI